MAASSNSSGIFVTPEQRLQFYERKFKLSEDIDAVLERCFLEHKDLTAAIGVVFKCLEAQLAPVTMFLRTFNEDLEMTVFSFKVVPELLQKTIPDLLAVSRPAKKVLPGLLWYAIPLDMAGVTVGTMGWAFAPGEFPLSDPQVFGLMNVVAEELDSYFFIIQENRRKHQFIMKIQELLSHPVLNVAIDQAIRLLLNDISIQDLLLIYNEEDFGERPRAQYVFFRENERLFDSRSQKMSALESLLEKGFPAAFSALPGLFQSDTGLETFDLEDQPEDAQVGRLLALPLNGERFSFANRELLQVFATTLRQRLVDFNRERNQLRHNFSPEATERLLQTRHYRKEYLSPQTREVGILIADISGFTRMTAGSLKDPVRLARFLNDWSIGALEFLFREGGALDKMIGDCLFCLFGPPFFEFDRVNLASRLVRTSLAIRRFSHEFFRLAENADIQALPEFKDLQVNVTLHICEAQIGLFGPNRELSAFGTGVRDALKLQTLSKEDEILVSLGVKELAEKAQPGLWTFDGPFYPPADLLPKKVYYKLAF